MRSKAVLILAGLLASTAAVAQELPLQDASGAFLAGLTAEQREKVLLPFNSDERLNWHFIPKDRLGLSFKDLTESQRASLFGILRAGLSEEGYTKVATIRGLENVLRAIEGRAHRDPELYYVLFFGEPSDDAPWTVRYEGHHISLNWTSVRGALAGSSPQFLGANPAEVRIDGPMKGTRALSAEEDLARQLLASLSPEQLAKARIADDAPNDILTSNQREAAIQEDRGVAYGELDAKQQGMLLGLIELYARVQPAAVAKARLDKIRAAGLDAIKFAWMGGTERGQRHYYRIQGSTFLVEYDNVQNDANHIHSVWRDFDGDFGRDLLKEHHALYADPRRPGVHAH
jgi:hypothetical protein